MSFWIVIDTNERFISFAQVDCLLKHEPMKIVLLQTL